MEKVQSLFVVLGNTGTIVPPLTAFSSRPLLL
uniref:Uncharacterized protein n=1 Tax=Anguilla anguilla TaxID=7936 RepID=A0A0E9S6C3_ANGAN